MPVYNALSGNEEAQLKSQSQKPTRRTGASKADDYLKWIVVTFAFTTIGLSVYGLISSGSVLRPALIVNLILGILTSALLLSRRQPTGAWYKILQILLWTGICAYLSYTIFQANARHPGSITRRSNPTSFSSSTVDVIKRFELPPVKPSTSSGTKGAVKNAYESADKFNWSVIACAVFDGGLVLLYSGWLAVSCFSS